MAEMAITPPATPQRVLLLHASLKPLLWGAAWQGTESLTPPLGLMYLGGPLLRRGHPVTFVDLNVDRYEEPSFRTLLARQDFILITVYADSLASVLAIIPMIASCSPSAFVLCGGPYCTLSQQPVPGAHLTVVGDAEQHIVEIVDALAAGRSLDHLPGMILAGDGRVQRTPGILQPDNLDDGINASWELARDKDYGYFFGTRLEGMALVMSSRGCPYRCSYCTCKGLLPYRKRSVDNVLAELRVLSRRGVRLVIFDDDNLLLNKRRTLAIIEGAAAEGLGLRFIVQGRVDSASLAFYTALRRAGVFLVMFGIESASQDVLDFYKKSITIEQARSAVRLAHQAGLLTLGFFILGAPMEGEEHIERTRRFLLDEPLDYVNINILGYYQGSDLWQSAFERGLVDATETIAYADETLSRYSAAEWQARKTTLLNVFYARPAWVARLVWKCARLGLLGRLLRVAWHARGDFLKRARSPFIDHTADHVGVRSPV